MPESTDQTAYQRICAEACDEQITHMVKRFLQWKLPKDFQPDCGIHFDADEAKKWNPRNHTYEPIGTNLFSADQAKEMIRFMIDGLPKDAVMERLAGELERVRMEAAKLGHEPGCNFMELDGSGLDYGEPYTQPCDCAQGRIQGGIKSERTE